MNARHENAGHGIAAADGQDKTGPVWSDEADR